MRMKYLDLVNHLLGLVRPKLIGNDSKLLPQ